MPDNAIILAGAAALITLGLIARRRTVQLVPVPEAPDPYSDRRITGNTPSSGPRITAPSVLLPLRSEAAIRGATRKWAIPNDLSNVAKLVVFFRNMAAMAVGALKPANYYFEWAGSELVAQGAPARNVALAQVQAYALGPKASA